MKVPLAGVIGHPIGHSKSPILHGHWLETLGLPGHYVPLDVAPDDLAQVLRALPLAGFRGVNVTIPHKEAALALADHVSETAARIGSANTFTFRDDGTLEADSTDGFGFMQNIKAAQPNWRASDGPAVVYGAGGACRAIIDALLQEGVPEIRLTNRTKVRAEALASQFGPRVLVIDWEATDGIVSDASTIVNTTSLGMAGAGGFDRPLDGLKPGVLATDLVYTPLNTPFLQAAAALGAETVDGLGMLLWQGVPGFQRWFGGDPKVTADLRERMLA